VGGLVGLLLVLGILGLLATNVMSSLSSDAQGGASGALDAARPAAGPVTCDASRTALETALATYELQYGEPAQSQQALVDAGLLDEPVEAFVYDPAAPAPVTGVGDCAD
jgi:hypothetical protein